MKVSKGTCLAVLAAWLASAGCTTLREVPRADYAARPERKSVRVETREGLVYEFDHATFSPDSLTGYRLRTEVEGPVQELAVLSIPLDDIVRLRSRRVDWYRTGLVGGGVLAGVIAVGLARANKDGGGGTGNGGPCGDRPCP